MALISFVFMKFLHDIFLAINQGSLLVEDLEAGNAKIDLAMITSDNFASRNDTNAVSKQPTMQRTVGFNQRRGLRTVKDSIMIKPAAQESCIWVKSGVINPGCFVLWQHLWLTGNRSCVMRRCWFSSFVFWWRRRWRCNSLLLALSCPKPLQGSRVNFIFIHPRHFDFMEKLVMAETMALWYVSIIHNATVDLVCVC